MTAKQAPTRWSDNPYWLEGLEEYQRLREAGVSEVTINLAELERTIFNGDGPAYQLLEAMLSVQEHEGEEGYRGAPRLVLALIAQLSAARI